MLSVTECIESPRLNGYRKQGHLYLIGNLPNFNCCKLPIELPAGSIPKVGLLPMPQEFENTMCSGPITSCVDQRMSKPGNISGMFWVNEVHYPSAAFFVHEARTNAIQIKIKHLHCGIKPGESWVLLAHRKAIVDYSDGMQGFVDEAGEAHTTVKYKPGIFSLFRVDRIEYVLGDHEVEKAGGVQLRELGSLIEAGVKLVRVIREEKLSIGEYPEADQ
jgi:hypothetical protein